MDAFATGRAPGAAPDRGEEEGDAEDRRLCERCAGLPQLETPARPRAGAAGSSTRTGVVGATGAVSLSGRLGDVLLPVGQILGQIMRATHGVAMLVVLSPLCYGAAWLARGLGEGPLYCVWFGSLIVAGFVSGWFWPRSVGWGALLITWSQSAFVYWQLDAAGEIAHPSSSTGGAAGWGIVTMLLVAFSPFPALASLYGWLMRKPARHGAPADDRRRDARAVERPIR